MKDTLAKDQIWWIIALGLVLFAAVVPGSAETYGRAVKLGLQALAFSAAFFALLKTVSGNRFQNTTGLAVAGLLLGIPGVMIVRHFYA